MSLLSSIALGSLTLSAAGSAVILLSLWRNPRLWLQDFSHELQERTLLHFHTRLVVVIMEAIVCSAIVLVTMSSPAYSQVGSNPGFETLKLLVGQWHGTRYDGKSVRATYELVSNGTALIERFQTEGDSEMVTVYAPDKDRLTATHFCAAGNQPHLQTKRTRPGQRRFEFFFVRATNVPDLRTGHMSGLVVTIEGPDSFSAEWNWVEAGQSRKGLFRYARVSNQSREHEPSVGTP